MCVCVCMYAYVVHVYGLFPFENVENLDLF